MGSRRVVTASGIRPPGIYQNGTMAEVGKGTKVEPGCEIVVPTKATKNMAAVTQWLSIGSSITGLAAMIATIANMVK